MCHRQLRSLEVSSLTTSLFSPLLYFSPWKKILWRKLSLLYTETKQQTMALKLNPFVSQSQKLPAFALPPMASFRSPKVCMAYTLNSSTKWVAFYLLLIFSSMPILFLLVKHGSLHVFFKILSWFWIWVFVSLLM